MFIGENYIECNYKEGIDHIFKFGILVSNEIFHNRDTGILLEPESVGNLVMNDKLVCNIPKNIDDRGMDNIFINNIERSCEPYESPDDFCDDCPGEMDHCQEFVLDIYNEA